MALHPTIAEVGTLSSKPRATVIVTFGMSLFGH